MTIIDFGALVSRIGPAAVGMSLGESKYENTVIAVVMNQGQDGRVRAIRKWLEYYRVFQGFSGNRRDAIAQAVLNWADCRPPDSSLATIPALLSSHASLVNACGDAYGKKRDFASLASKALWLRYPNEVPLFDSFAQRALWMLAKIEPDLPKIQKGATGYAPFALIWRTFYDRYSSAIAAVPDRGYPYRVRIFDRILWILGAPAYKVASALGIEEESIDTTSAERSARAEQGEDLYLRGEEAVHP